MSLLLALGLGVLFFAGAPIFAVMIGLAAVGASVTARSSFLDEFSGELVDVIRLGTGEPAQVLSTIPLFILAGYLMAESKTADRIVRAAQAGVGWLPGGLAVVTIIACAIFTTFTGASGVTIVALGGLLMPSLLKEGYPQRFSLGLVAGTGSVGLLFPPALPLFVYGTVYGLQESLSKSPSNFSTDRFVFAGIVPGLVLIGILSVVAVIVAIVKKVPRTPFDFKAFAKHSLIALPETAIPVLVILGLVKGISIPEIASLTVVYVFLLETFVYKDLEIARLPRIVRESMALVGAIFIIIFAASALTNFFITAEVPQQMVEWIQSHVSTKWGFLLALNVLLIFVGMVMDIFSAIVVVVPLITPVAKQYGIDPYHLGVIFLLNLELGYLTPPVGLNLFITSFKFQRPVTEVVRATIPFLLAMIVALGLVTYIPALTIVPEAERRGRLADLVAMVKEGRVQLSSVQEVTLPNGTVKRIADCKKIAGAFERNNCEMLFADVTKCRKLATADEAKECESKILEQFVADADPDSGWDDDESWDEDEAEGDEAPEDDTADGDTAGGAADGEPAETPADDGAEAPGGAGAGDEGAPTTP